jgi:hypothetical protein
MKTYFVYYIAADNPHVVEFWVTLAEDHIDAELLFNEYVEENDFAVEIKGIETKDKSLV